MVEIARCYKDCTGKVHLTLDAALEADENEAIAEIILDTGVGRGGCWSAESIARAIIERKEDLRAIFVGRDAAKADAKRRDEQTSVCEIKNGIGVAV